jgi:hypothetical protein
MSTVALSIPGLSPYCAGPASSTTATARSWPFVSPAAMAASVQPVPCVSMRWSSGSHAWSRMSPAHQWPLGTPACPFRSAMGRPALHALAGGRGEAITGARAVPGFQGDGALVGRAS